ncbi:hypothetical protein [Marinobacter subterrani]|uniref:Uncharacterized protein n=1 Tax=Marinobacter subterrani TaxID=1658765 RepID=A0A0J7JBS8_9GAMM|nr:hypothetical protein [Marinobacter subterrani]KMQ73768.1 hypothetical protein Msub_20989 [Marinobacter subterrani]KMQ75349.1 hypothetical protein Msub_11551 [Marinobacter subterrani]KMQ76997.1 hypothetical protein Msub_13212 [Marinobacter subterrani]
MSDNPFLNDHGYGPQSAADRIYAVERFDLDECRAALDVPGLQKAVANKLHSRIRKLEWEAENLRHTELGQELRCTKCNDFWPDDKEFYFQAGGRSQQPCKACYALLPSRAARKAGAAARVQP